MGEEEGLVKTIFNEVSGDFDDVPNPGETHNIDFDFFNPSQDAIYDINMLVNSNNPYITILNGESTLNDIEAYGTTTTNQSISVSIDINFALFNLIQISFN